VLSERFGSTTNAGIRCRVLEVCASALREVGADFVRYAWGDYPATVSLWAVAQATAACLPYREGFSRVTAALTEQAGSKKRDLMSSLGHFHSPEALDWIEQNIFEPITEAWGYLAAASQMDWPRAERWLAQGRPLSLVAIDALAAIVRPQSPFLRAYQPRLHQQATPTAIGLPVFSNVLPHYFRMLRYSQMAADNLQNDATLFSPRRRTQRFGKGLTARAVPSSCD